MEIAEVKAAVYSVITAIINNKIINTLLEREGTEGRGTKLWY